MQNEIDEIQQRLNKTATNGYRHSLCWADIQTLLEEINELKTLLEKAQVAMTIFNPKTPAYEKTLEEIGQALEAK